MPTITRVHRMTTSGFDVTLDLNILPVSVGIGEDATFLTDIIESVHMMIPPNGAILIAARQMGNRIDMTMEADIRNVPYMTPYRWLDNIRGLRNRPLPMLAQLLPITGYGGASAAQGGAAAGHVPYTAFGDLVRAIARAVDWVTQPLHYLMSWVLDCCIGAPPQPSTATTG